MIKNCKTEEKNYHQAFSELPAIMHCQFCPLSWIGSGSQQVTLKRLGEKLFSFLFSMFLTNVFKFYNAQLFSNLQGHLVTFRNLCHTYQPMNFEKIYGKFSSESCILSIFIIDFWLKNTDFRTILEICINISTELKILFGILEKISDSSFEVY